LLASNLPAQNKAIEGKEQICFLSYDLRNRIESFPEKNNNPLQFPDEVFVEAEEIVFPDEEFLSNPGQANTPPIHLKQTVEKELYIRNVNALKQHIKAGDIYEINYCMSFEAFGAEIDPVAVYRKLNAISQASYSALVKLGKQYIISSSPELFLSKKGDVLVTKPIKGTARRSADATEDEGIKNNLQQDKKERNENVMIVDVARNDLSRLAKKGTVNVDKLFAIESYKQVHQMVSTVSCRLKENTSFDDIIKAGFPMASMTGAPKIRAMQLIDDYELYNRNAYSGALGYINSNGDFDLNVLIRSIFYDSGKKYLSFTVGSAITALCDAETEYEECLLKAKAMIEVLLSK
jgi:para-aminobenzoate synthetase component 1